VDRRRLDCRRQRSLCCCPVFNKRGKRGWIDELFSLWASDVSLRFIRAFSERIVTDSNPPLYYTVLYLIRWLITDDRTAIFVVNIAAIMIAAGAVFLASRRAGLRRLAIGGH
jgi:hypothetical protein